jgi:hypothetical protein
LVSKDLRRACAVISPQFEIQVPKRLDDPLALFREPSFGTASAIAYPFKRVAERRVGVSDAGVGTRIDSGEWKWDVPVNAIRERRDARCPNALVRG